MKTIFGKYSKDRRKIKYRNHFSRFAYYVLEFTVLYTPWYFDLSKARIKVKMGLKNTNPHTSKVPFPKALESLIIVITIIPIFTMGMSVRRNIHPLPQVILKTT